ncbi:MAG: efflux RND transporter periplasmic adaptor subunit [Bryobacteraceae bacterium]
MTVFSPGATRLAAALAILSCAACSRTAPPASAPRTEAPAAPAVPRVAVVAAAHTQLDHDLAITAEFRPYQEVDVMAKVAGYLSKIEVDVGSRVEQGQLLATIEVPEMADEMSKNAAAISRSQAELERARQDVKRAETAREMTELSYSRLAAVSEKRPGLVAQQEIDTVKNRDLLAQSQVAAAKSTLAATEQSVHVLEAEAARLRTLQAYLKVTAPFAGVVTKRFADTGAMIQAGSSSQGKPIVRVAQTQVLRLVLPVPEAVVPRLRLGMPIGVHVESLGRNFDGRVARFSNQIQTSTRTMDTEVDVPNQGAVLVPGMFAEARLVLEHKTGVGIPVEAVDHAKGKTSVMLVGTGGTLEQRDVVTGLETPEQVEIVSGVAEGDLVVIGNRSQLRTGQKVDPQKVERPRGGAEKGRG